MHTDKTLLYIRRSKTACYVTPYDDLTLYRQIDKLVNEGITHYLFNADTDAGLRFARQVLLRKKKQKGNKADNISLIAVTIDENAIADRNELFRNEYFDILSLCDEFIDIKGNSPDACEKFMLSKSGHII